MLELLSDAERLIEGVKVPQEKKDELLAYADRALKEIWQRYKADLEPHFQAFKQQRELDFDRAWQQYESILKTKDTEAYAAAFAVLDEIKQKVGILNTSDKK